MKIGPLESKPATAPVVADRKAAAGASVPTPPAEPSAKVDLSTTASELAGGQAADPAFDKAKVERIAQAIRDGQFKPNPEAIADKLIINAEELLGAGRKFS
jgi:negative regulator of flagellin synthesis FlgM